MKNDLIEDLLLLDFNKSGVVYSLSHLDFCKYKKIFTKNARTLNITGYAIEHKSRLWGGKRWLYGLFVRDKKVFFFAGNKCFNVTPKGIFVVRKKIGFFRYSLILKRRSEDLLSVYYCEFAETQPEDMDSHFFVDVLHWLKDFKTKSDLIKFWESWK